MWPLGLTRPLPVILTVVPVVPPGGSNEERTGAVPAGTAGGGAVVASGKVLVAGALGALDGGSVVGTVVEDGGRAAGMVVGGRSAPEGVAR